MFLLSASSFRIIAAISNPPTNNFEYFDPKKDENKVCISRNFEFPLLLLNALSSKKSELPYYKAPPFFDPPPTTTTTTVTTASKNTKQQQRIDETNSTMMNEKNNNKFDQNRVLPSPLS